MPPPAPPVARTTPSSAGRPAHFGYRLAPVFARATDAATIEAIRKQAVMPEAVDASGFLSVRSVISTGEPDSYKTVMDVTTLKNYAVDAAEGVSVLYGHDTWAIVGRSYSGVYAARPAPGRCESDCYIPAGVTLGGPPNDDVIRSIALGMLRDVSVGFTGGEMRCSICERSIWDYECPHVPGVLYKVEGKRNPVEALAIIVDAHLAEYSLVYAGSTPSASVLEAKALREADAGRLAPEDARALEVQHRDLRLGASHRAWAGAKGDRAMDDDDRGERPPQEPESDEPETEDAQPDDDDAAADADGDEATESDEVQEDETVTKPPTTPPAPTPHGAPAPPSLEERVRTLLSTVVEGDIGDLASTLASVTTELGRLRPLAAEVEAVRQQATVDAPLIAYGRAWLEREVAHALAEGQRALGDKFDRAKWEGVLRAMEPEAVRMMADGWTAQGDQLFRGGRQTTDAARAPAAAPPISPAVAAGFRA